MQKQKAKLSTNSLAEAVTHRTSCRTPRPAYLSISGHCGSSRPSCTERLHACPGRPVLSPCPHAMTHRPTDRQTNVWRPTYRHLLPDEYSINSCKFAANGARFWQPTYTQRSAGDRETDHIDTQSRSVCRLSVFECLDQLGCKR